MQTNVYLCDVEHPAASSCRRAGRDRVLGRPRYLRGPPLDAPARQHPLRVHRPPRPARRGRLRRDPAQGHDVRRRAGAAHRVPGPAGGRGHRRAAVRRLPHLHRRPAVLQHHAARPRGHGHDARLGHAGRRGQRLGRRQHVQGQRHRALLPLRPAGEPAPADLQALARSGLHLGTRRARRDVRLPRGRRPRVQDERRQGLLHRLEHPRRHARGQGPRVPRQGRLDRQPDHGRGVVARRRARSRPKW